jgi:ribosome biogenesis GTPase
MTEYTGKIIGSVGGLYTVVTDMSTPAGRQIKCRARGVFRHNNEKPLVGDHVAVGFECEGDAGNQYEGAVIKKILERRNSLIRPPVANLDYIYVTLASASPEPDTETVDRLVSIAEFNRITPVIVIGKSELNPLRSAEIEHIYRLAGYDVFKISCHTGEGIGKIKNFIEETLPGHTAAFAGASGVGKSSLLNLLFPDLRLMTSDVSRKTERGRHTTRCVTLYPVLTETGTPGYLADTPGFSLLDFEHFDFFTIEDLPGTFREFSDYIGHCRYTKCGHTKEEGCAVIQAVREGKIAASRHQSYINLFNILKTKHTWDSR